MSTMIQSPTARTPTGGRNSGTLSGAAQGAATGAMVAGPVGAVVGGVVGAIGGFIGGSQRDKSRKQQALAAKWAIIQKEREAAVMRRNIIRDFRNKRAGAMVMSTQEEGGRRSSAPQGAQSSLGAQYSFGMNFFEGQVYAQRQYQKHMNKAGKYAAQSADTFATMGAIFDAAPAIGGAVNAWQTRAPAGGWGTFNPSSVPLPSPTINVGYPTGVGSVGVGAPAPTYRPYTPFM